MIPFVFYGKSLLADTPPQDGGALRTSTSHCPLRTAQAHLWMKIIPVKRQDTEQRGWDGEVGGGVSGWEGFLEKTGKFFNTERSLLRGQERGGRTGGGRTLKSWKEGWRWEAGKGRYPQLSGHSSHSRGPSTSLSACNSAERTRWSCWAAHFEGSLAGRRHLFYAK